MQKNIKGIVYLSIKYIFAEKKSKKISLTTGQFNTKLCLSDAQGCYVGKLACTVLWGGKLPGATIK